MDKTSKYLDLYQWDVSILQALKFKIINLAAAS